MKPTIRVVNLAAAIKPMPRLDRRRTQYTAAVDRISHYLNLRGAVAAGLQIVR